MTYQYIIFTDLDGTLLDHHTYSFAAALPTLAKLAENDIPVIANTSKTYAELVELRQQLKLDMPFIVENGAAVYIPEGFYPHQPSDTVAKNGFWVKEFSPPIKHWLELIDSVKDGFEGEFTHFSEMSTEQICTATGLSEQDAKLAATREYCEPVLWTGSEQSKTLFTQAIEELGASPLRGGRFLHVTGDCNKGHALEWMAASYQKHHPEYKCRSIALGDGHNDIAMLEKADLAVRILSPTSPPPPLQRQEGVTTSTGYGPVGWAECIEKIVFS